MKQIERMNRVEDQQFDNLLDKLFANRSVDENSGCWNWTGCIDADGYGRPHCLGKRRFSHRISYEIFFGSIPDRLYVLHKCDNPKCFNPEHLFLGTAKENYIDSQIKGRNSRGTRHGNAKLTEESVRAIREDMRSIRKIGKDYQIHSSRIWRIKNKQAWTHVD